MSNTAPEGPVVLITGAARRIGAGITRHLHGQGYRVIIHCKQSIETAAALCDELNMRRTDSAGFLQADLGDVAQVSALAKASTGHWGRIDALVNNASSFYPTPLAKAREADWNELIGSNLKGPYFLCQALAQALTNTGGSIVNIADIHARQPLAEYSMYCIAKAGNVMLTKSLAKELAPGVRVNGVAPGAILWPENATEVSGQDKQAMLRSIPLGRLGDEMDIARLTHFLIADASYINGQVIAVDGGSHLK